MIDDESDDEFPQLVADDITANGSRNAVVWPGGNRFDGGPNTKAAQMRGVREPVYLSIRLPLTSLRLTSRTISSIW